MKDFEAARDYVSASGVALEENLADWDQFVEPWYNYLNKLTSSKMLTAQERDSFYKTIGNKKWAGSSGLDSVLIAYDALLRCDGNWHELCHRAMLHGGDSDSTGCIAGSFYGVLYGLDGVDSNNYKVSCFLISNIIFFFIYFLFLCFCC